MVEQASVQAKLLVQRYPLHGLSCSGNKRNEKCPLCEKGVETLKHFLLECPLLEDVRRPYLNKIIQVLDKCMNITEDSMVQIILDPSVLILRPYEQKRLAIMTRKLCFTLHHQRTLKLGGGSSYRMIRNRLLKSIMY